MKSGLIRVAVDGGCSAADAGGQIEDTRISTVHAMRYIRGLLMCGAPCSARRAPRCCSRQSQAAVAGRLPHRYCTSKPSRRKHALCASISVLQFASPCVTTHASRAFLVSAREITRERELPLLTSGDREFIRTHPGTSNRSSCHSSLVWVQLQVPVLQQQPQEQLLPPAWVRHVAWMSCARRIPQNMAVATETHVRSAHCGAQITEI